MDSILIIAITWQGLIACALMVYGSFDYLVRTMRAKGLGVILAFLLPFGMGAAWIFSLPNNPGGLVPVVAVLLGLLLACFVSGSATLNGVLLIRFLRSRLATGRFPEGSRQALVCGVTAFSLLAWAGAWRLHDQLLSEAIDQGRSDRVRMLVPDFISANRTLSNDRFNHPLHLAAHRGEAEIVDWLLRQGADVNRRNAHGRSPLESLMEVDGHPVPRAAKYDAVAAMLIDAGAEVSVESMHWLFRMERRDQVVASLRKRFVNPGAIKRQDPVLHDFISESAFRGERGAIEDFLDQGGSPNVCDRDGVPILLLAMNGGADDLVRILLERGAEARVTHPSQDCVADARDYFGFVHSATIERLASKAPELRKSKSTYAYGPPLHHAARYGLTDTLDFLLCQGADIDALHEGVTALYQAAEANQIDAVRILLSRGADPNLAVSPERTPLAIACGGDPPMSDGTGEPAQVECRSSAEIVKLLLDHRARMNGTEMRNATENQCFEIVKILRQRGAGTLADSNP